MGKKGGIFEEWFKNIAILIFLQSFHAIFLAFVCEIIGEIGVDSTTVDLSNIGNELHGSKDTIIALFTIVSIMSLIKMEKMIKGIFGLQDSKFMGNVGENFAKGMAGIKSAGSMAARTVEPAKRTAKLISEKTRNNKDLINAKEKATKKQKEYDDLVKAGPSGSNMNRKEYTAKLKEAREAAEQAHKDVAVKEEKGRKLTTDIKHSAVQTGSTFGSSIAAGAFALGGTDTLAEAAIVANMTDKVLDGVANPKIKDTVYGRAAREQEEHIRELPQKLARERVRRENPTLDENSPAFEQKVNAMLNRKDFKKQLDVAMEEARNTKFEIDMEIPTSKLKQIGRVMTETLNEGATTFSADSRAGRAYSRNVRKNGIQYKGTNVSDVDDI